MPEQAVLLTIYLVAIFLVNGLGIDVFIRWSQRIGILQDTPNSRSTHKKTMSRGAGVVFVWSTVLSWCLLEIYSSQPYLQALLIGGILVASVSFLDDLKGLSISSRLFVHITAASLFVSQVALPDVLVDAFGSLAILWMPLAVFFVVAVTNIYNFMDGLDGLAAGHSSIVLGSWIAFGVLYSAGVSELLMCLSLLVPLLGFLIYNWHPARVFMGDVGSTFIGFTFGCMALMQIGQTPRIANFFGLVLLMMPFLFDASFTIISRYLRGEPWYRPHRLHLFQRMYDCGIGQLQIVMYYLFMTAYSGVLLVMIHSNMLGDHPLIGGILFLTPYLLLYSWVWSTETESAGSEDGVAIELSN